MKNNTESQKQPAADFVAALTARGVTLKVRNNRLWLLPASAHGELSDAELLVLRHHREEIKRLVIAGLPTPTPASADTAKPATAPPEPDPIVYVGKVRVTLRDVHDALEALGDEVLADFHAGRMSKAKAYDIARMRLCAFHQMRHGRPRIRREQQR